MSSFDFLKVPFRALSEGGEGRLNFWSGKFLSYSEKSTACGKFVQSESKSYLWWNDSLAKFSTPYTWRIQCSASLHRMDENHSNFSELWITSTCIRRKFFKKIASYFPTSIQKLSQLILVYFWVKHRKKIITCIFYWKIKMMWTTIDEHRRFHQRW